MSRWLTVAKAVWRDDRFRGLALLVTGVVSIVIWARGYDVYHLQSGIALTVLGAFVLALRPLARRFAVVNKTWLMLARRSKWFGAPESVPPQR
jgi:hypothetical protein